MVPKSLDQSGLGAACYFPIKRLKSFFVLFFVFEKKKAMSLSWIHISCISKEIITFSIFSYDSILELPSN